MKIFVDTQIMEQSAYFGWQDKNLALLGLREGYKNSADELVEIAIKNGYNNAILDTYIFPILFSYRHCIEIILKHIYMRKYGNIPKGGHDLLALWDVIKKEVIDKMESLNNIDIKVCNKIRSMIKELQEANQRDEEVDTRKKQVDQNAEVWRYLISTDDSLFFTKWHFIDYIELKKGIDYLYEELDYIYDIVDDYLSI